ncbi:MAG: BhlA/UviB family holin-like peptide [Firmicutes bacterium]|nr:BhlA/UviB family holin-like peptide [Bacillota bacterium]
MWDNIISLAINNGLWATLFVGLMIYILRDGDKREKKYQETIEKLADSLQIVKDIQDTTKGLQETTKELQKDVSEIKFKV